MKKVLLIFVSFFSLFLVGCTKGSIDEITFDDYQKMIENKESFILFIGSHKCSHCIEFKAILEEIIEKYRVHFKYIDIANLTDEQDKQLSKDIIYKGTPTTVFIEEGKDNSCNVFSCDNNKRIDGALSSDRVVEVLKNMKYIKG